jgi:predicted nucleic acid-binding protein
MIVVSDTSPINYLILINCETLLKALSGKVAVPTAVLTELQSEGAPQKIRHPQQNLWVLFGSGNAPSVW